MYLIVFTVTALLIQSAEGDDCLDGVKLCTSKYFSVIAENLFDKDMVCLSTKDFIKCVYRQNCFTSQTEKVQFYQSIHERLNNNFGHCGFTAQQVINDIETSIVQLTTKSPTFVSKQTTPSMPECTERVNSCLYTYRLKIQAVEKKHDLSCNDMETLVKCVVKEKCSLTQSMKQQMIDGTQKAVDALKCPFTMSQLLDRYNNSSPIATPTNVSLIIAVIVSLLYLKKFV